MTFIPKRSAALLGGGVVVLVAGQALYGTGQNQSIEVALGVYDGSDGGSTATTSGLVVIVVGLILLVVGLTSLPRSIDYLAAREHARSVIDSTTGPEGGSR